MTKGVDTDVIITRTPSIGPFPTPKTANRHVSGALTVTESIAVATDIPKSPTRALKQQSPEKNPAKQVSAKLLALGLSIDRWTRHVTGQSRNSVQSVTAFSATVF